MIVRGFHLNVFKCYDIKVVLRFNKETIQRNFVHCVNGADDHLRCHAFNIHLSLVQRWQLVKHDGRVRFAD